VDFLSVAAAGLADAGPEALAAPADPAAAGPVGPEPEDEAAAFGVSDVFGELLAPVAEEAEEAAAEVPPWGFALLVVDEGTACVSADLVSAGLVSGVFGPAALGASVPGVAAAAAPDFGPSVEPAEPPADCFSSAALRATSLGSRSMVTGSLRGWECFGPGDLTMAGLHSVSDIAPCSSTWWRSEV